MFPIQALLRRFSIRLRMTGAILMVLALFGLVGAVGLGGGLLLKQMNADFMGQSVQKLSTIARIAEALDGMRLAERDMVIGYEDNNRDHALNRKRWDDSEARVRQGLQTLLEGPEDEDNVIVRELLGHMDQYRSAALAVFKGLQDNAYDTGGASIKAMRKAIAMSTEARAGLQRIEQIVQRDAAATQQHFQSTMANLGWIFAAVLAVVVLLVVPLTLMNSVSITRPISYAQKVAEAIARGDLTQDIQVDGQDEASHMLRALREMQTALTRMVGQLRDASQAIRGATAEVAQGNHDLSQRTEQSAANLQQTASSIVQLTQTVRQSAESALTANQLAASAAQVAERGGDVVARVVTTMEEIHASSRRIADIIGTIDGIAFQTNILALNAAVEAARAGEQGRGFAVVAGEVRALAQRSAGAAREIKSLIGSSVDSVENGSQLVKDAGATMREIVESVHKVTAIIGEITTAAREQSEGIGQVNSAVSELDRMTQQNAALVEESAAASSDLGQQATRLNEVVDRFRLVPA